MIQVCFNNNPCGYGGAIVGRGSKFYISISTHLLLKNKCDMTLKASCYKRDYMVNIRISEDKLENLEAVILLHCPDCLYMTP